MELVSKFAVKCNEDELMNAVKVLARMYASYDGDPVDDVTVAVAEDGTKIVRVMTPVGEELFFMYSNNVLTLRASSWSGRGELERYESFERALKEVLHE